MQSPVFRRDRPEESGNGRVARRPLENGEAALPGTSRSQDGRRRLESDRPACLSLPEARLILHQTRGPASHRGMIS